MPQIPPTEEKDPRTENRVLHDWALSSIFTSLQDEKSSFTRSELESSICDSYAAPLGVNSTKKRVAEIVRTTINVLLGLNVLQQKEVDSKLRLHLNVSQAYILENVDHYTHALFLFEEANAKLFAEETALLQELINRVKSTQSSTGAYLAEVSKPITIKPNASSRNKKRKSDEGMVSDLVTGEFTASDLVATMPDQAAVRVVSIEQKASLEAAVQRVRSLQLMLHRPGARAVVEATLNAHPDRPRFIPGAFGPLGANEMAVGAKDSRGPSMPPRIAGGMSSQSTLLNGNDTKASADLANNLKPGYEIELKTQSIDFAELASQFELWNGQDSDVGVSGRSSPRPASSPGAESHINWHPSVTPSPPPPGGHHSPVAVQVPQFTKLPDQSLPYALESPPDVSTLSEEEKQEEIGLGDNQMLTRHNGALEEFRIKYEREQEKLKKIRRETREAGEKTARIVVAAAARARSLSAAATKAHKA